MEPRGQFEKPAVPQATQESARTSWNTNICFRFRISELLAPFLNYMNF